MGFAHVTFINIFAIIIEYNILKNRTQINRVGLRTILANLTSLIAGLVALVLIPESMNGNIFEMDGNLTPYDSFTLVIGLLGLFLMNVAIEFPVIIVGQQFPKEMKLRIFNVVLFANLLTNLPVFLLYGLLML